MDRFSTSALWGTKHVLPGDFFFLQAASEIATEFDSQIVTLGYLKC